MKGERWRTKVANCHLGRGSISIVLVRGGIVVILVAEIIAGLEIIGRVGVNRGSDHAWG